MEDTPDSKTEKEQPEQKLRASAEGRVTLVQEGTGDRDTAHSENPQRDPEEPLRKKLWGLIKADPSAFITALATAVIAAFTFVLVCVSTRQGQTMQRQLDLSERPWIKADLNTLAIIKDLTFNEKGGFLTLSGEIANTGNSVALHTMVNVRIMDASQLPADWEIKDAPLCGQGTKPPQSVGDILFPTDHIPFSIEAELYPSDIQYALAHGLIKGKVMPMAVICIRYQSTFEKSYHRTQYLFSLERPLPSFGLGMGAFEPKGTLEGLRLTSSFFGNMAD